MSASAYDTAWLARLIGVDDELAERALDWLRSHQHADGSFGAAHRVYPPERLVCTLAALTALTARGLPEDRERVERARQAVAELLRAPRSADEDTIGFEMLVPMLLDEARAVGAYTHDHDDFVRGLAKRRAAKLASLPSGTIDRSVSMIFSAELVGRDGLALLDLARLQEADGSVGGSPAATAFFAAFARRGDRGALAYLRGLARDGAVPVVSGIDVFERAWGLWNLRLAGPPDHDTLAACQPHLDALERAWAPGRGISSFGARALCDGDATAFVYETLASFGRTLDLDAVLAYEGTDHFRTYPVEANPSISTNVHVLAALTRAGGDAQRERIAKLLAFLRRTRLAGAYWHDKWHGSPYYTTAHAIIASASVEPQLVAPAVAWILATQRDDGSWGHHGGSAEETAHALQALVVWRRHGHPVADQVLVRGGTSLRERAKRPHPPLWIGKVLYCPLLVVRSAVLSALALVEQEVGLS